MVGGTAAESFIDDQAVDEDSDGNEDQEEDGKNEYDVNDEFVDDGVIETGGEDFHNRVNKKRLHDGEDQQPCSSRKKTTLEEVIESYEEQMQGI